jgi:diacylglycerol kinase (ATP)
MMERLDYEIYVTKSLGDAQGYVRDYLKSHDPKETYRFYACGGDGTLYDVVNGAYGFPNAEVACSRLGSGNDFVKNFHDLEAFRDLDRSIAGKPRKIDFSKWMTKSASTSPTTASMARSPSPSSSTNAGLS